jgi:alcohol/geraniol dehydrogenase (NADP+)
VTRDTDELVQAAGTFDFILSTVSGDLPWDEYLAALKPQGTLSVVGMPASAIEISPISLLVSEKKISGGAPASQHETKLMLD